MEIVSPGDESWEKLPFYAAYHVDEVLIVDPQERSVSWLGLQDGEYRPIERSALVELGKQELAEQLDWPQSRLELPYPDFVNSDGLNELTSLPPA